MPRESTAEIGYSISEAFELFVLDMQARRLADLTVKFYRTKLKGFFVYCEENQITTLDQITTTHVKKYQVTLHHYSPHYQHGIARAIRAFLNYCVTDELISSAPSVNMPKMPKHIPIVFTPDEVDAVLSACKNHRDKAICLMLLDTGLRSIELVDLNFGDVSMKDGSVHVISGKGSKGRIVYIGATTRKQIKLYLMRNKHQPKAADPLFVTERKSRISRSGLMHLMQRLRKRSGVEKCKAHTFRRTFAVNCLRNEMNIYVLAKLMGHADIHVLKSYLEFVEDDLETAHEQAGPVDHMKIK